jgi:hypothetical protein
MTEPVSLHSFCKENGNLPKTSVRRWLNDNGYSTSNGLSPAAVEAALAQFCPTAVEAAPATAGLWPVFAAALRVPSDRPVDGPVTRDRPFPSPGALP